MQINAKKRTELGKKAKKVKADKMVPAVVFGKGMESTPLAVSLLEFLKVYKTAGETSLIDLKIGDAGIEKVLVKDVQTNPVTNTPVHVGFYKVNLKEKTRATVPVEVIGAELSPILKSGEGVLLTLLNEVDVECLPSDIPHEFTIDVSGFTEVGTSITAAQLQYDKNKVKLIDIEPEELIVKIDYPQREEEEAVVDEAAVIANLEATKETDKEDEEEEKDDGKKK